MNLNWRYGCLMFLVNNTICSVKVVFTGSPQGCVVSPLIIILYTNNCSSTCPNRYFIKYTPYQTNSFIHDKKVEVVDEYNYLGTTIDNRLKWDRHCRVTYKTCQQRLYCLRKRCSFNVDSTILSMFL